MWTEWSSRHRFARLVGIVVLSVLVIPFGAALADCPIEEWTLDQATALVRAEEGVDGIGGSGALADAGGDEDGIGGSGIFGSVQCRFESAQSISEFTRTWAAVETGS